MSSLMVAMEPLRSTTSVSSVVPVSSAFAAFSGSFSDVLMICSPRTVPTGNRSVTGGTVRAVSRGIEGNLGVPSPAGSGLPERLELRLWADLDAQVTLEHVLGPEVGGGSREYDLTTVHEVHGVGELEYPRHVLLDDQQGSVAGHDL